MVYKMSSINKNVCEMDFVGPRAPWQIIGTSNFSRSVTTTMEAFW
jgi:hypothetical protein